jgi:hypothetical protein
MDSNIVPDLNTTGFNDRASSLRIESGYWMFCTDANFHGECRTFGPGEYPELPGGCRTASPPAAASRTTTRTARIPTGSVADRPLRAGLSLPRDSGDNPP